MNHCMKRRLLYASAQSYQPRMEIEHRRVGWIKAPIVVRRELLHRGIDQAIVGRVREGVVVAFRGSLPPFFGASEDGWEVALDWLNDSLSVCIDDRAYGGGVHLGFSDSLRRLWGDAPDGMPGVLNAARAMLDQSLLDRRARQHLFVTGHSKGGALANLFAARIARLPEWREVPISVATVAAARTGNAEFAANYAASRIACLRYELPGDPVPQLPGGADTPRGAYRFARTVWPRFATADYRAVGELVAPVKSAKRQGWTGSRRPLARLFDRRGLGLAETLVPALAAHAICPGSGYDRLVCSGEAVCDHGVAQAAEGFRLRA